MNLDVDMTNNENINVHFILNKMNTLKVPDDTDTSSCEYLKDGKLFFDETKLRPETHVSIAEKILEFRAFRANLESAGASIIDLPSEYKDLIAVLVQDSDEPLTVLLNRVNDTLSPFLRNENMAHKFDTCIEKIIKKVAHRVNYGLKKDIYSTIEHTTSNIPWHLYTSRWEVFEIKNFPQDIQQVIMTRRNARQHMTEIFSTFIQNLPAQDKATIVNTKHRKSPLGYKEPEEIRIKQNMETEQEKEEKRRKKEEEKRKKDDERRLHEQEKKQREEEKRLRDEEKKALEEGKRKQKEEEKRLKDEERRRRDVEKKKKEQSQLRLTTLFAKTSIIESSTPVEKIIEPAKPTLFPPFYIKENVVISKLNNCYQKDNAQTIHDFINTIKESNATISKESFLSKINTSQQQKRGVATSVDIKNLLLPGSGDILHVPNVRLVLRMKLLQYHENVRPAYYGTFTKKSYIVSGRKPFAQDLDKLDYDIDSEAEWEPEGEGEDIVSGDEDEDDPGSDMIDPEDAGWLVPEGYLSDNEGVDEEDGENAINKSSRMPNNSKKMAIRKIVLGPYFTSDVDDDHELVMKPFETQFFIDVSSQGYNPFYKEPTSRSNQATQVTTTAPTSSTANTKPEFTDEHRDALIHVINGKPGDSIPNLITEAKSNWILKNVSKRQLEANIKNIAIKEKRGKDTKPTWYIKKNDTDIN